ncbi:MULTISPECIES: DUF1788 domain-containing protein [Crocosphaera]|uniref:Cytoplasmic protein n=3 Tax=Crocosphaera watsonii TaxID=263511 RepID=G5J7J0_CROWT|nr:MULTISPECIES: DUF1788 domain-containing protein [Crocosphaera]EHJ11845.1 hypothetical protein CWATWH0003_3428 [Crocosphaera watsonii WH 0003]MCH2247347.1 DUF1788 domain-containing protein [Crocosphaera sp.]NQZ62426.1 DUF1788 domain-containing protein [Crocosphaera sp.]CCQ55178.1 hypothetical protein CWATWH0005_2688 [Crocosphaera watsonii WH 0005]CCQ63200.1 putative cytoplasmic protein [Crocosphaera watsonii WH 0401]
MSSLETKPLSERFEHLLSVISGQKFLQNQGIGNEVPFFICSYEPKESIDMELIKKQLIKQLHQKGVHVLEINLYDLAIELLQERDIFQQILEIESSVSKEELKELLQNVLDSEEHLIPAISKKLQDSDFNILFLSGVGEVFPYIRSHNVINNLQSTAKDKPTVMFFPGEYTHSLESGASLDLFGLLQDDKYYRAFNIYEYKV